MRGLTQEQSAVVLRTPAQKSGFIARHGLRSYLQLPPARRGIEGPNVPVLSEADARAAFERKHGTLSAGQWRALDRLMSMAVEEIARAKTDAARGVAIVEAASRGGRTPKARSGPTDAQLRTLVLELHARPGRTSWTAACNSVGRKYGLAGRTVRRRIPETRW